MSHEPHVTEHAYASDGTGNCAVLVGYDKLTQAWVYCNEKASAHVNPGDSQKEHLIKTRPHPFTPQALDPTLCDFGMHDGDPETLRVCGYPEQLHKWATYDRYMEEQDKLAAVPSGLRHRARVDDEGAVMIKEEGCDMGDNECGCERQFIPGPTKKTTEVVRLADIAQYEREPMPDEARKGPVVTLIDAPVDPLGTLAVIGGIYVGKVRRSKAEVSNEERREMLDDMLSTVLSGPLESIQFTFLVEGVSRSITHQMVRNRFAFFAQESLRFAVAEDWAQEVPLPPSLAGLPDDAPPVGIWRKALNASEDSYNALIGAGVPAEEARGVLAHDITTRLYWTVDLRSLIAEAGKRTCTQAQFPWRRIFAGVAKAFRDYRHPFEAIGEDAGGYCDAAHQSDLWQYQAFADLIRPVCYQQGRCGFMAKFDRGCTIRNRVDANERIGRPSSEWDTEYDAVDPLEVVVGVGPRSVVVDNQERPVFIGAIDPSEWAADPGAARVVEEGRS
jgi:flavin-dependent thymidylate synthase